MTEQTTTAPQVTTRALADMRDVLLELGFVAAEWAPREKVIAKIDRRFGLQNWLTRYGHAA